MLPLVVKRSSKNGSKGKTIVSPSRSFKSVMKALKRVGILGLCKAGELQVRSHNPIQPVHLNEYVLDLYG